MDATANEIDVNGVDIKGFPTIMLFPSGKKEKPISFDKAREVSSTHVLDSMPAVISFFMLR